jgi:hypothetical protein
VIKQNFMEHYKSETGKKITNDDTYVLSFEGNITSTHQGIADALNSYFLSAGEKTNYK